MKIVIEVGELGNSPLSVLSLSRYPQFLQIGLVVKSHINQKLIGEVTGFSRRGYGSVNVKYTNELGEQKHNKYDALYEWELVIY
jgi:hypothetical protein